MKKYFYKKRIIIFVSLFLVLSFGYAGSCNAAWDDLKKNVVDGVVGSIASLAVSALGWIMNKVIAMVIGFAQYSDFVNNEQVKAGWEVVRDICNMFFILILLFIAFAVILRMESYSIKKSLPKLLIMAVLINFSRTICGILIDFSQIVMLTFIGPITVGSGNFSNALNVQEFLTLVSDQKSNVVDSTDAAVYYVIAVIFMLVSTVVMTAILISFIMRIVMFWVYIVLSPLAFLLSSFPGGQKYAGQFWGDFTKYLLNGPVLAFFLWLSLYVLGDLKTAQFGTTFSDAPIKILEGESFAKFTMAIGMLVGGLTISAQIGGMGANWGASTVSNLKNKGIGAIKRTAAGTAGLAGKGVKNLAGFGVDELARKSPIDLNLKRVYGRAKKSMDANKALREEQINKNLADRAGEGSRTALLSHGGLAWDTLTDFKKLRGIRTFIKGKGIQQDELELKNMKKRRANILSATEDVDLRKKQDNVDTNLSASTSKIETLNAEITKGKFPKEMMEKKKAELIKETEKNEALKAEKASLADERFFKVNDHQAAAQLDERIKEKEEYNNLHTVQSRTERADADAKLEATGRKTISEIDNTEELIKILKEGISEGNQGLIAATMKKITKKGDYNDMMKAFGQGTGTKDLQAFARKNLYGPGSEAGLSKQTALSIIGEVGNVAKDVGHYAAYGSVKMNNGKWEEASDDESQVAQLSELLKVQPQKFAREIGRLGMGQYTDPQHSDEGWQVTKAAAAYIKLNAKGLQKEYGGQGTGQQSAVEYLARVADTLERQYKVDSALLADIKARAGGQTSASKIIEKQNADNPDIV